MPFALTFTGLILIITGFQNTYKQFGGQLQKDFTGPNNFFYWIIAIGIAGSIGYIQKLEPLSRLFMVLIILTLVIKLFKDNPNFFSSIGIQLQEGSTEPVNPIGAEIVGSTGGAGGGGGGGGGLLSSFTNSFASSFGSSVLGSFGI